MADDDNADPGPGAPPAVPCSTTFELPGFEVDAYGTAVVVRSV